jgi:mono/diheme cytochrome c family protein
MRKRLLLCLLFAGCETANYAPLITAPHKAETTKLQRGRQLFVHRCIECHTLPAMWKYSREDWPRIVNDMSHRASLKLDEREAIVAYILAARASEER